MADTALTGLTDATALDADDLFYAVEDGASVKATGTQVATLVASIIVPSDIGAAEDGAITASGLTMATARLLGRTTASTGAVEEITVGAGLSLSAGALTATFSGVVDADDVTYTPTTLADWDGSADPGDVEQALDQLAERVTDVEGAGGGTVTNTGGALTSNALVLGAGSNDSKVVAGLTTDGTSAVNLGVAGASVGKVVLANATSGTITLQPVTGALGTVTLSAPATTGTLALVSDLTAGYQPLDSDLTTIAGLTATTDNFIQSKSSAWASRTPTQVAADLSSLIKPTECIVIPCSDETTALTTGTAKVTFRMPYAFTLATVRASVTTAPTGGTLLTVDINEGGTTILSTKLTFDDSERTTTTAATPAVISDSSLADDAEMTIDIDAVGSTIAGAGLKVYLIGVRT